MSDFPGFPLDVICWSVIYDCDIGVLKAYEPQHEFSNNVVCVTSKASDQPAHMRSLIIAFANRLNII